MLRSYIKTAFQNFLREKGFSLINIVGLSIGITSTLLIALFIWDELSFDTFHREKNLYRVALHRTFPASTTSWAVTPVPMAEVLARDYPEVKKSTRLYDFPSDVRVLVRDNIYYETNAMAADSNFFELFGISLIAGNEKEVLQKRNQVVLTESMARKYFGTTDAVGKQIKIFSDTTLYEVSGISEDVPANCHFKYDLLISFITLPFRDGTDWTWYPIYNYVVLDRPESKQILESKFSTLVEKYIGPQIENILGIKYEEYVAAGNHHNYYLQPVEDIHLHSNYISELNPNSDVRYIYLFSVVCFFLLFIAGVNFTNISTAQSFKRAKEIAIRKVHGSLRRQLVGQFLFESVFITLIALVISLVSVYLLIAPFNNLTAREIHPGSVSMIYIVLACVFILLTNGILAGLYPALIISALQPISILKGKIKGNWKSVTQNVLLIGQFGISVIFILSTVVIFNQLEYLKSKKMGFDKEHLLVVERPTILGSKRSAFNDELRQLPGIVAVSNTNSVPGRHHDVGTFQAIGSDAAERTTSYHVLCDFNLIQALGVELVAGRNFSKDIKSDSQSLVVNESLVKSVGWKTPEEAIGQKITIDANSPLEIIGVVKDFNFESLHAVVEPVLYFGSDNDNFSPTKTVIRYSENTNAATVVKEIDKVWSKFIPDEKFEFAFMNLEFERLYRQEEQFGKVFTIFSVLAIMIAAIGVIGLSTFMAAQRIREIGIRKVVGASVANIMLLLSKDFLRLALIANLVSAPLAWYGLNSWLNKYPYHTSITVVPFVATVVGVCLLVFVAVSWHSLRAALVNPINSLRSE